MRDWVGLVIAPDATIHAFAHACSRLPLPACSRRGRSAPSHATGSVAFAIAPAVAFATPSSDACIHGSQKGPGCRSAARASRIP
jgi:hypothetical protein